MKVYKINTEYTAGQPHFVVADDYKHAERIYLGKYRPTTIKSIELIGVYVQVQDFDEPGDK